MTAALAERTDRIDRTARTARRGGATILRPVGDAPADTDALRGVPHLRPVPDSEPPLVPWTGLSAIASRGEAYRWSARPIPDSTAAVTVLPHVVRDPADEDALPLAPRLAHRRWPMREASPLGEASRADSGAGRRSSVATPLAHGRIARPGSSGPASAERRLPHRPHSASGAVREYEGIDEDDDLVTLAGGASDPHAAVGAVDRTPADDAGTILARALLEALGGQRPIEQLRKHCASGVFQGLQDFPMLGGRRRIQLVSLWLCEPDDETAEISVAFRCQGRTRALALQLRALGSRWLVTSIQLG